MVTTSVLDKDIDRALQQVAIPLVQDVGDLLMEHFGKDLNIERKEDGSLSTEVDKFASDLILNRLSEQCPSHALLDEERKDDGSRYEKDYCWISDPLDSTSDYVNGRDGFGVILALTYQFQPIVAVTYKPKIDELVYSVRDHGAYVLQGSMATPKRIFVSQEDEDVHILVTRSRRTEDLDNIVDRLNVTKETRMGGALKLVEVAKGDANVCIYPPENKLHHWDLAAPVLHIEEAGGTITDCANNLITFDNQDPTHRKGIIATNGKLHQRAFKAVHPEGYQNA